MKNIIHDNDGCHMYIECSCRLFDHLCCIHCYIDEDTEIAEFYLEFRPMILHKHIKGWFPNIKRAFYYLQNIWYAIKGIPNKYSIDTYWTYEQAKQIQDFIQYCTTQFHLNERK
jgi:hypothetical protein